MVGSTVSVVLLFKVLVLQVGDNISASSLWVAIIQAASLVVSSSGVAAGSSLVSDDKISALKGVEDVEEDGLGSVALDA